MRMIEFTREDGEQYTTEVPHHFPDSDYTDEQMQHMLDKARSESRLIAEMIHEHSVKN